MSKVVISSLYVCMAKRKIHHDIISTDEDPSLRIESFVIIKYIYIYVCIN